MKRDLLKEYFRKAYSGTLLEQDDPLGGDEEGGDATGDDGGDEGGDEGGDDPFAADEGGDEEGGDDEGGDEGGGEEKDEGPKADESDEVRFAKSFDDQLQAIFIDIEADSIKSAQVQEESYTLKRVLLKESDDVSIDIDRFAAETARLIMNFDAFFDTELVVLSKMRSFLLDKYGEEVADDVDEILADRHGIMPREDEKKAEDAVESEVPIAVGASAAAGP